MPSEAINEPLELALRIMEQRAYLRAKQTVENSKSLDDIPDDPMAALVQEIQWDIAKEARNGNSNKRPVASGSPP